MRKTQWLYLRAMPTPSGHLSNPLTSGFGSHHLLSRSPIASNSTLRSHFGFHLAQILQHKRDVGKRKIFRQYANAVIKNFVAIFEV